MFKKILCFGLLTFSSTSLLAQLIELKPSDLQLPRVAALPSCSAVDYGKMVFLTTTNKAQVCSVGGWVVIDVPTTTFPISNLTGSYDSYMINLSNNSNTSNAGGIYANSYNSFGVIPAIYGASVPSAPLGQSIGVLGVNGSTNANGFGVKGEHFGTGSGVFGTSNAGKGVLGRTTTGNAVNGEASGTTGIGGYFSTSNSTGTAGRFVTPQGSTGRAIYSTGLIRFEGISEGAGKVLVSDAAGLATWQNITKTNNKNISQMDFVPNRSDHVTLQDLNNIRFSSLGAGQTVGVLFAPIDLPDGSNITNVKFTYIDNNSTGSISSCSLLELTASGGGVINNILTSATTDSPSYQTVTISPNITVNKLLYTYRIQVNMNAGVNLGVKSVEITYTYPVN